MNALSNTWFRKFIPKNENVTRIKVDRRFLGINTLFRFESLTLIPEYYSIQAAQYEMDPDDKDIEIPFQLEFDWLDEYTSIGIGTAWQPPSGAISVSDLIKNINKHFDLQKPTGMLTPILYIDWIYEGYKTSDADLKMFYKEAAPAFYNAIYDETLHNNYMPESVKNLPYVNSLLFPTTTDSDILNKIRIRLHTSPNTIAAFSNELILRALGWSDEAIPQTSLRQKRFYNKNLTSHQTFVSDSKIPSMIVQDTKGFKISQYIHEDNAKGSKGIIYTNKQRQRKSLQFASDISDAIQQNARNLNLNVKFKYDITTKVYSLDVPIDSKFSITMHIDSAIASKLGYGNVEKFSDRSKPLPAFNENDVSESDKKAKALTKDTGMVIVELNTDANLQTDQFSGLVVATLEQCPDGTMASKHTLPLPAFEISFSTEEVELRLYRFNESERVMPLGWKVGGYLQGRLIGFRNGMQIL